MILTIRCPRCRGQVYRDEDGDCWCLACGESLARPGRPASEVERAQVEREWERDFKAGKRFPPGVGVDWRCA